MMPSATRSRRLRSRPSATIRASTSLTQAPPINPPIATPDTTEATDDDNHDGATSPDDGDGGSLARTRGRGRTNA